MVSAETKRKCHKGTALPAWYFRLKVMENKTSFEIKYIMSAKNFNQKQAENFLKQWKFENKIVTRLGDITLCEFIEKTGGVSPIISPEILKIISDN